MIKPSDATRKAELEAENLRLIACGKEMIMGNRRARSRATAAEAALADERARVVEECAKVAEYQATISGCQRRKTKTLGLPRDAYFTEIGREVAAAIRALATVKEPKNAT